MRNSTEQPKLSKISELGSIGFIGMFTASLFISQAYSIYWAFYIVFSAVVQQLYHIEINNKSVDEKISNFQIPFKKANQ